MHYKKQSGWTLKGTHDNMKQQQQKLVEDHTNFEHTH